MGTFIHRGAFRLLGAAALCLSLGACGEDDAGDEDFGAELEVGGELGKADSAGIPGLPVNGNYAASEVWKVTNNWEDTDTAAAREAGMAWGADSGLNWDEKFALWIESLDVVEGHYNQTFNITTPWGKEIQAAKLDCADVALTMRASFAAWYNLPFFMTAFDGGRPIYFGHFGIRDADGIWNNMPSFATKYEDHSAMGEAALGNWPEDSVLRNRGVQAGDDQDFLGEGARTGAYLDEIHLNKRAGHFIRLMLIFTGSPHIADSRNTFNVVPEAIREGDVNLHRWQAQGIGHTMFVLEVDKLEDSKMDVRLVEGSLPPIQPHLLDATGTSLRLTNETAGGLGSDGTNYAEFNGGLKRFRVAKQIGGAWTNTWMAADEASWIDDRNHVRMQERITTFQSLLGEVDPDQKLAALVNIVEQKREHLRDKPASCSARIKREEAFDEIYNLAAVEFGQSKAEVDAMFRAEEDYIFAELEYTESKTCCWNSSTGDMFDIAMQVNAKLQEEAAACLPPVVFKASDGGYEVFAEHNRALWIPWSADEHCPQQDTQNDVEVAHEWTNYCDWKESADDGGGDDGGGDSGGGDSGGDAPSCEGACGEQSADGCWCDDACVENEDCCDDVASVCG